jgi:lysozyme family protein
MSIINVRHTLEKVMKVEGGYSNHPDDRGGETNYGITKHVARAFGYMGEMRDLPYDLAMDIYIQRYWLEPKFDRVALMSSLIAEEMLDTGINMGQSIATKFLQRALNVLNRQAKDYPDITVDGALGTISLAALASFLKARGTEGERVLHRMLNSLQSVRYIEIAERNASQESFQYGWQKERVA